MNKAKELKIGSSLDEMFRVEQFVEEISDEFLNDEDIDRMWHHMDNVLDRNVHYDYPNADGI